MARFIRPQALRILRRHSDLLVAAGVLALGLWAALGAFGVLRWLGYAATVAGLAMVWLSLQRLRFRPVTADGPGVIQVIEGEIRYFGPHDGAFFPTQDIDAVTLSADGALWLIDTMDGQRRALPRTAQGADALFDAFASLPGLGIEHLLRISAQAPFERAQRIWTRPRNSRLAQP